MLNMTMINKRPMFFFADKKKQQRWVFQDHPWPRKCSLPFEGAALLYLIVSSRCNKVKSQLPRRISFSVKISGNLSSRQMCNVWIMICRSTGTLLGLIVLPCFKSMASPFRDTCSYTVTPFSRDSWMIFVSAIWGEFGERISRS